MIEQSKSDTGFEIMPASEAKKKTEERLNVEPRTETVALMETVNKEIYEAIRNCRFQCVVELRITMFKHINVDSTLEELYSKKGYTVTEIYSTSCVRGFTISWK